MALEGTFDTISVIDVLSLVGATGQSGWLVLDVPGWGASIGFVDGAVVAVDVEGEASAEEVIFFVLLEVGGRFRFIPGPLGGASGAPRPVGDVVRAVERLAAEWEELVGLFPADDTPIGLTDGPSHALFVIDEVRWAVVRAIAVDGVRSIAELALNLGCSPLEARRVAADAHRAGLLSGAMVVAPPAVPDLLDVTPAPAPAVDEAPAPGAFVHD